MSLTLNDIIALAALGYAKPEKTAAEREEFYTRYLLPLLKEVQAYYGISKKEAFAKKFSASKSYELVLKAYGQIDPGLLELLETSSQPDTRP